MGKSKERPNLCSLDNQTVGFSQKKKKKIGTSSMVAAICYGWLLENKMRMNKGGVEGDRSELVVVSVISMRREKMWKQWQAARLFHHIGPDAMALLFSDEVDLETLMMAKKLSILVVGQDILVTNDEVGSRCTLLANNYCEDAYDLLQTPLVKNLLGGAPVELRISQRKTYHDDGVAQNGRNPSNLKSGTTNTVSPKIAT